MLRSLEGTTIQYLCMTWLRIGRDVCFFPLGPSKLCGKCDGDVFFSKPHDRRSTNISIHWVHLQITSMFDAVTVNIWLQGWKKSRCCYAIRTPELTLTLGLKPRFLFVAFILNKNEASRQCSQPSTGAASSSRFTFFFTLIPNGWYRSHLLHFCLESYFRLFNPNWRVLNTSAVQSMLASSVVAQLLRPMSNVQLMYSFLAWAWFLLASILDVIILVDILIGPITNGRLGYSLTYHSIGDGHDQLALVKYSSLVHDVSPSYVKTPAWWVQSSAVLLHSYKRFTRLQCGTFWRLLHSSIEIKAWSRYTRQSTPFN